jgi:hypothetical protein
MANAAGNEPSGRPPWANTTQDLRVSDTERDAIVSELGQHFQDGRLDTGEFDQRVSAALAARTRGDLDQLMTDLPRPAAGALGPAGQGSVSRRRPPILAVLPLLIAAVFVAGALGGWHHHAWGGGWPFAPFGLLWLIIPALAVRFWILGGRRRQWR